MLFGSRAADEDAPLPEPIRELAANLKSTLDLRSTPERMLVVGLGGPGPERTQPGSSAEK
jgi:hypothetical protein